MKTTDTPMLAQDKAIEFLKSIKKPLVRFWGEQMDRAAHSCYMNHLIDGGEWSSSTDESIYFNAAGKVVDFVKRFGVEKKYLIKFAHEMGKKERGYNGYTPFQDLYYTFFHELRSETK